MSWWARLDQQGDNGKVPSYREQGIVLRTHKLGEADRIITLLSRSRGKIRAVARGVRRTSSKFGGRLEPFSHVDLQCVEGRSLDVITQAETLHAYDRPLRCDYQLFTAGQVMAEVADTLVSVEGEPALRQYRLLLGALHTLGEGTTEGPLPAQMILGSYLLRALAIEGYAPVMDSCARCGLTGPHLWFSPEAGGMVCQGCRPPRAAMPTQQAWGLLVALMTGEWSRTVGLAETVIQETFELIQSFASWHTDNRLRSLSLVDVVIEEDQSSQAAQIP